MQSAIGNTCGNISRTVETSRANHSRKSHDCHTCVLAMPLPHTSPAIDKFRPCTYLSLWLKRQPSAGHVSLGEGFHAILFVRPRDLPFIVPFFRRCLAMRTPNARKSAVESDDA